MAYVGSRKCKDILTRDTTIPDLDEPSVKRENGTTKLSESVDFLENSKKDMLELLTMVEKSSVYFLQEVSCAGNVRKAGLSLKEH